MRPSTCLALRTLHALALALGLLIMALLPTTQVSANGPHVRSREVFSGPVGPYEVRALTAPVVGTMHLSIYVAQPGSNTPVSNSKLQVSGIGPQGPSQVVGPVWAAAAFGSPGWYGVNLPIDQAGNWVFRLVVQDSPSEAQVEFPVNVRESGGISWGIIGVAAVVLAIAAWGALSWMRGKGRKPQTGTGGRRRR